jgi:hypothetical protein
VLGESPCDQSGSSPPWSSSLPWPAPAAHPPAPTSLPHRGLRPVVGPHDAADHGVNRSHDRNRGYPGQRQVHRRPEDGTGRVSGHLVCRGLLPPKQLPSPLGRRCWQRRRPTPTATWRPRLRCPAALPAPTTRAERHLPGQGPPKRQGGLGDLYGDRLTGRLAEATGAVVVEHHALVSPS